MKQHVPVRNVSCSASSRMAPARENGFSLIELMIVVALVATLAGITVPAVAGAMRSYTLNSAAQQIASTIRSARVQAVGKNRLVEVRFDFPADNQYQIVVPDDATLNGPVMLLPVGASFGAVSANVEFTTSGRLDPGLVPPVTIVVSNGDETQDRTISVTSSGRVQLP
jgi:prepilin-type N-terminal cleavage/methylation domain-containing protein